MGSSRAKLKGWFRGVSISKPSSPSPASEHDKRSQVGRLADDSLVDEDSKATVSPANVPEVTITSESLDPENVPVPAPVQLS